MILLCTYSGAGAKDFTASIGQQWREEHGFLHHTFKLEDIKSTSHPLPGSCDDENYLFVAGPFCARHVARARPPEEAHGEATNILPAQSAEKFCHEFCAM